MQNDFYYVYSVHPQQNGEVKRRLLGRFAVWNDHLYILEDHFGYLEGHLGDEGWITGNVHRAIESLGASQYIDLVTKRDMTSGSRTDLVRPLDEGEPVRTDGGFEFSGADQGPEESTAFDFHRGGAEQPERLEVRGDKLYLNGAELDDAEADHVLSMLSDKSATIRIPQVAGPQAAVAKAEKEFESLAKIEPHLSDALGHVREAVKGGYIPKEALAALQKELFVDSMVPGVGNKRAYRDFLSRPKKGVHIRMDGNDFGAINKVHGFEVGDASIHAMGNAIREAMEDSVGTKNGKVFRIGGDEFHAYVPNHEHAAQFARAVHQKLGEIPAIGGTHNLSLSVGFGTHPEHAEQALIQAKLAKKAIGYKPGRAKTHVHSLLPGFEGPLKTESDRPPLIPPPEPIVAPVSAAPTLPVGQAPVAAPQMGRAFAGTP